MKRRQRASALCTACLVLCFTAGFRLTPTPVIAQDTPQTSEKLTDAPGVEVVRERCLLCHNEDVVVSQNLSRARWNDLLDWMQQTQGMAELPDDKRVVILDYLEVTQPPRELSLEDSPWAAPRYRPNPIW